MITGASSGIVEVTARSFSDAGHPLLLLVRRLHRLEALKLPNKLCEKVDNAGVMLLGSADTQDPKEWEQIVQVNIMGVLNGIHVVLPGMKERRNGTIINVSSIVGPKTFPNHSVYCGTKC